MTGRRNLIGEKAAIRFIFGLHFHICSEFLINNISKTKERAIAAIHIFQKKMKPGYVI